MQLILFTCFSVSVVRQQSAQEIHRNTFGHGHVINTLLDWAIREKLCTMCNISVTCGTELTMFWSVTDYDYASCTDTALGPLTAYWLGCHVATPVGRKENSRNFMRLEDTACLLRRPCREASTKPQWKCWTLLSAATVLNTSNLVCLIHIKKAVKQCLVIKVKLPGAALDQEAVRHLTLLKINSVCTLWFL